MTSLTRTKLVAAIIIVIIIYVVTSYYFKWLAPYLIFQELGNEPLFIHVPIKVSQTKTKSL